MVVHDWLCINSLSTARGRQHDYIKHDSQHVVIEYRIYAGLFLFALFLYSSLGLRGEMLGNQIGHALVYQEH